MWLPKFKLETEVSLNRALRALRMGVIFKSQRGRLQPDAAGTGRVRTDVGHKSYVDVKGEGTQAAVVTAVIFRGGFEPLRNVVVDRPFLFAIRDNLSGTILFLGRVLDPRTEA